MKFDEHIDIINHLAEANVDCIPNLLDIKYHLTELRRLYTEHGEKAFTAGYELSEYEAALNEGCADSMEVPNYTTYLEFIEHNMF